MRGVFVQLFGLPKHPQLCRWGYAADAVVDSVRPVSLCKPGQQRYGFAGYPRSSDVAFRAHHGGLSHRHHHGRDEDASLLLAIFADRDKKPVQ
jgi:hypothetical protein